MNEEQLQKIIIGQEVICPKGLGRVVSVGNSGGVRADDRRVVDVDRPVGAAVALQVRRSQSVHQDVVRSKAGLREAAGHHHLAEK